jgi:hypothetical protein
VHVRVNVVDSHNYAINGGKGANEERKADSIYFFIRLHLPAETLISNKSRLVRVDFLSGRK